MTAVPQARGPDAVRGLLTAPGTSPSRSAARLVLLTAAMGAAFVLGQAPFRYWEALTVAAGVRSLGFDGVLSVQGGQILLSPGSGSMFWVDITPSCSSLGPALAITLVVIVISAGRPASDRWLAGIAGVVGIIAGNFVRIGSSVIVGLLAGRVSLVLFHDWVGSVFGFAYTIGGFVFAISVLLRRGRGREGL
jgi:carbamoyl-phosphate synthase large subunit